MRILLSLGVMLLLASLAAAQQHAKVQGVVQGEVLLPTQGVAVEKLPASPDKRPVLLKWKYPAKTRTAPAVEVWVSVDGGPWAKVGETLPGALNYSYDTEFTNTTHCYYLVPVTRNKVEGKPSPTTCEYIDEIPTPTDVSVQAQ